MTNSISDKRHVGRRPSLLAFFRIRFLTGLQYRAAALAGCITQFAWGFLEILMFHAFYRADSHAFPMEFSQLSSYVWLQQAFLAIFMVWFFDSEILESISSGQIACELIRPINLYDMWFVKNLAIRLSKAVLRCIPILMVAMLLPFPYGLSLPATLPAMLCFLISLLLGFLIVTAYCMLVYIASFYLINPQGMRIAAAAMTDFLSGGLIPLPFLPDSFRKVLELTPFASMQNLPCLIYGGSISGREMYLKMLLQLFWALVMIAGGKLWMRAALKRVVSQGG